MSDDSCIKCTKVVRPRQEAIQCEKCSGWQHRTCNTGISRDQYREAVRESTQIEWVCQDCTEASEVLRFIDRRLPEDISLDGFVADFEAGLWQALKQRFPRYAIQGCAFHWSQAVFRKVQEHGLQTAYNQKDSVYTFLRQLMALRSCRQSTSLILSSS
ncbi:unnamed protein product [Mytilus coruscus]|uniref:PHD-type domain-containing protein n=1 Tax=Mytilus coruscus TaxID=42192 RepID=A0A6J8BW06_MYTCO|nr:unnamed protein product [Mytilus coruscus]